MKDSRVSIWTNSTAHLTGSTTNTGPTVDLFAGGVPEGGTRYATNEFGVGGQIIQTSNSGTGQVTVWKWQFSTDDSTWADGGYIASLAMTTSTIVKRKKFSIRTTARYFRLHATNTGTGASTSKAYAEEFQNLYPTGPADA